MARSDDTRTDRETDERTLSPDRAELTLLAGEIGLSGGFSLEWILDRIERRETPG